MNDAIAHLQNEIEKGLQNIGFDAEPKTLYAPAEYLIKVGGKRLRPAFTLLACGLYNSPLLAMPQALAVEVFHNFTLMHDDIMDEAPLRRGQQTVHEKWNLSTAILSGDAMLVRAYQLLAQVESDKLPAMLKLFSQTAIEVCEGQQYDMDFQSRTDVSEEEYIHMIQLKTSVLLGCAMQMGAWVGGASDEDAQHLYHFGLLLGTSFQIKDDLLDVFGDPEKVGKQVGGDILANKKTLLLLHAKKVAGQTDKIELNEWLNGNSANKVAAVTALFKKLKADVYAQDLSRKYYTQALAHLQDLHISDEKKSDLKALAQWLLDRSY